MPEYLVTYRDNNTGYLFNIHVCNVEDATNAIAIASNSMLDIEEDCTYESLYKFSPESSLIPF